jgi:signal transduction histidine kinase
VVLDLMLPAVGGLDVLAELRRRGDTPVRVRIGSPSDPCTVRVEDEGPGFFADFAERAFDLFTHTDDARTRDTGGAGLGLAIAHGLVLAHDGQIWIEPGAGGPIAFAVPPAPARSHEALNPALR